MPKRSRSGEESMPGRVVAATRVKGRSGNAHGARVQALVHDEVDREVLHGRIEQLFHHPRQPVNLVYEQDVALVQIGEDAHEVAAALERRAGGGDDGRGHLVGKDGGEGGLAEPRRPGEQARDRAAPRAAAPPPPTRADSPRPIAGPRTRRAAAGGAAARAASPPGRAVRLITRASSVTAPSLRGRSPRRGPRGW